MKQRPVRQSLPTRLSSATPVYYSSCPWRSSALQQPHYRIMLKPMIFHTRALKNRIFEGRLYACCSVYRVTLPGIPVLAGATDDLFRSGEAGLLQDLAPTDHFGLHKCLQLVERLPAGRVDTEIDELLLELGRIYDRVHLGVEPGQDRPWRLRRRDQHRPSGRVVAGHAHLRKREYLRRGCSAFDGRYPKRAQFSPTNERQRWPEISEHQLGVARDQGVQCGRAPCVGEMRHLDPDR